MNHDPELTRFQSSGFPVTPEVQMPSEGRWTQQLSPH
jgi:hypothetical protein